MAGFPELVACFRPLTHTCPWGPGNPGVSPGTSEAREQETLKLRGVRLPLHMPPCAVALCLLLMVSSPAPWLGTSQNTVMSPNPLFRPQSL